MVKAVYCSHIDLCDDMGGSNGIATNAPPIN